jgi:signal transduction histidine kinase
MAAITHDLKSPLNAILGFSEVLRDSLENARRIPDEDRQDMLKSIGMGQHQPDMIKLIAGILTMTRIEASKESIEPVETLELNNLLRNIADTFRLEASSHKINFRLWIAEPLPPVYWDVLKIQFHVINNVVANALKFTPKGGRIELSAAADHVTMIIIVGDKGPGIPVRIPPASIRAL